MADPKIKFDIEANAQGSAGVDELARSLDKLDASVNPALAANAKDIAAQLRAVGEQQAAVALFRQLKLGTTDAAASLASAQASAQAFARALAASEAPTRSQIGQLEKLKDAVRLAKAQHQESVVAVQQHRQALAAAGIDTQKLTVHQQDLAQQAGTLSAAGLRVADTYRQQAGAANSSADVQGRAHKRISDGVRSISDQLSQLQSIASAAIGGQMLGGLAGQLSQTADQYTNLAARIKLTTGEGAAFESGLQGVFDVATRTGSALEGTATLFQRINSQAEKLGINQQQALALTETINQAIQVSGGSAQSSEAALVQLIQGLQSGVLRGEEFNSVMEQAPRLAKALADGLGVTTSELRKQAEAGKLTSEVVIGALQGQARVVAGEFSQLPPTVGRAIQNLSTEWTRYVGEVDKANGISTAAAKIINALAGHLDTLGAALYSVGKATVAYQALKLAQTFMGIGAAAKTAAVEVAAVNAATTASAANGAAAATGMARFASVLSGLKAFTLIGVLTNLKEIGTWIGEGVAKWQGYGKALEEAERSQRAMSEAARDAAQRHAEHAQKLQMAADAALGLTNASRLMVSQFDDAIKKGDGTAAALDKVSKALVLGDMQGIRDAGTALDALALKGKASAQQIADAMAGALAGKDLAAFEATASAAFDATEQGARRLATALDAVTTESLRRAGTSAQELGTGFSQAATTAINNLDALVVSLQKVGASSTDAGRLLSTSLNQALQAATTETAVNAVIDRFKALGEQGKISGQQMADGLVQAQKKLDDLKPGINSLQEALSTFGLKSRSELQATADKMRESWNQIKSDTTVSLADKIKAFEQYAAMARDANGGVESSEVALQRAILKTQADVLGLGDAFERGMGRADAAVQRTAGHLDNLRVQTAAARVGVSNMDFTPDPARGAITGTYDIGALGALKQKQAAGLLKAEDLNLAEAAYQTALVNQDVMQKGQIGFRSPEYIESRLKAVSDAKALLEQIRALNGQGAGLYVGPTAPAATPTGSTGTQAPAASTAQAAPLYSVVRIELQSGMAGNVAVATPSDHDLMVRLLKQIQFEAGVSAP